MWEDPGLPNQHIWVVPAPVDVLEDPLFFVSTAGSTAQDLEAPLVKAG